MPRLPITKNQSTTYNTGTATGTSAVAQAAATLHFGGSLNRRTGRLGPKPKEGSTYRKIKRLETIVRLEAAAFPDSAIAPMLGISVPRLQSIKKSTDYLTTRIRITHGIILDHDGTLATIKAQRKEVLTSMLPPALQILANELAAPATTLAERKHKTELARDILDREGTFAKISKTEIKPVDAFEFEKHDRESDAIIAALRGAASSTDTAHTTEAVEANEAFSRSRTLSAVDQQAALDVLEEEAAKIAAEEEFALLSTDHVTKVQ